MVSGILAIAHSLNKLVPCGASAGCGVVASDPSSFLFGVPFAYYGVGGYAFILTLSVWRAVTPESRLPSRLTMLTSAAGTAASAWLTWHSIFSLNAICAWCLASAVIMVAILGTSIALLRLPGPVLPVRNAVILTSVFVAAALGGATLSTRTFQPPTLTMYLRRASFTEIVPEDAPVKGDISAPVTIVEFADFNCQACKEMHIRLTNLVAHHPGRASLVFRHLPLTEIKGHESSMEAAVLAATAGRMGRFWEFVDLVFGEKAAVGHKELDRLFQATIAKAPNPSDVVKVKDDAKSLVLRDATFARKLGFQQTPTYIVLLNRRAVAVATSVNLKSTLETPDILKSLGPRRADRR